MIWRKGSRGPSAERRSVGRRERPRWRRSARSGSTLNRCRPCSSRYLVEQARKHPSPRVGWYHYLPLKAHPKTLADSSRRRIVCLGNRADFAQSQCGKCLCEGGTCTFARITPAPDPGIETPSNLHGGQNRRKKDRNGESYVADDSIALAFPSEPAPESTGAPLRELRLQKGSCLLAREAPPVRKPPDLGLLEHYRQLIEISRAEFPKLEPIGHHIAKRRPDRRVLICRFRHPTELSVVVDRSSGPPPNKPSGGRAVNCFLCTKRPE